MKYSIGIIFSVVIIFTVCVFSDVQAGVLPEAAKVVPAETVLLVDVANFSELRQQFEKTNFYKLYKDPAMAAFVDDFKAKWREKVRATDNEIAKAIVDAGVLPQGKVAVALVAGEQSEESGEPGVLLITQWGETIDKIKEAVEKMVRDAVEDGAHRKTEDYRGVDIVTLVRELPPVQVPDYSSYTPGQQGPPSMKMVNRQPVKMSYCFIDDCLIAAMDMEVLKFVIAHIQGASSPVLADDADYRAVIAAVGPYHDIDFYINVKQIVKTVIAKDTSGKAQSTIVNLGFDNVAGMGYSVGFDRGVGSSCRGKAFVKVNGAKKGIFKMLELESAVLRAPRFVPESAYSVTFLNLNIKKAYDELHDILYRFDPVSAAGMYTPLLPAGPEGQPAVQLKTDIIDHLGSQIIYARSTRQPFSSVGVPVPPESLVALAAVNRQGLEKSLSFLHDKIIAANNPEARRELLGHTIYLVSVPTFPFLRPGLTPMQLPDGRVAPQMATLAFTVTDTHLILGGESAVERAIRTLSSTETVSLGSAEWFAGAKLAIPSVVGLASLRDNAASSEFFWRMMKESAKAKKTDVFPVSVETAMFGQMAFAELVNVGLLPEFGAVRKYFGSSILYGVSRGDGFFFEFNYLKPSGTD